MSIENEVLEYVGSFIDSMYGTLRYTAEVRPPKKDRRSYIPEESSIVKTPASDMYQTILKFKKGEVPSSLSAEQKKDLADDLELFTLSPKLNTKGEFTSFTMSKKLEEQLRIAAEKKAKKAA